MALLDVHPVAAPLVADDRDVRATLRRQITRLERELMTVATSSWPHLAIPPTRSQAGPRLLSCGDLEQVRDELAGKVSDLLVQRRAVVARQTEHRNRLERMLLEPGRYKFERISAADIGDPGCKHWHVRPRLGIVGMLAGWWHVKVSSGCPLAWGPCSSRPRKIMGKRSRKRATGPVVTSDRVAAPPPRPRKHHSGPRGHYERMIEKADSRPKAPWHPFPLIELAVLAGIAMIVIGLIKSDTDKGKLAAVFGFVLCSVGGLDTAVREHFAGFRSHSTLLSTFPAALLVAGLGLIGLPPVVLVIVAVGVFGSAFFFLRGAFRERTGLTFKK